jgi:hypothetical protein
MDSVAQTLGFCRAFTNAWCSFSKRALRLSRAIGVYGVAGVDVMCASSVEWQSSSLMLLELKPSYMCDVISGVAESMVDVAGVEAQLYV